MSLKLIGLVLNVIAAVLLGLSTQLGVTPQKLKASETTHGIGESPTSKKLGWKSNVWRGINIVGWFLLGSGFISQLISVW